MQILIDIANKIKNYDKIQILNLFNEMYFFLILLIIKIIHRLNRYFIIPVSEI